MPGCSLATTGDAAAARRRLWRRGDTSILRVTLDGCVSLGSYVTLPASASHLFISLEMGEGAPLPDRAGPLLSPTAGSRQRDRT